MLTLTHGSCLPFDKLRATQPGDLSVNSEPGHDRTVELEPMSFCGRRTYSGSTVGVVRVTPAPGSRRVTRDLVGRRLRRPRT